MGWCGCEEHPCSGGEAHVPASEYPVLESHAGKVPSGRTAKSNSGGGPHWPAAQVITFLHPSMETQDSTFSVVLPP